jgi:hypothetical protein
VERLYQPNPNSFNEISTPSIMRIDFRALAWSPVLVHGVVAAAAKFGPEALIIRA